MEPIDSGKRKVLAVPGSSTPLIDEMKLIGGFRTTVSTVCTAFAIALTVLRHWAKGDTLVFRDAEGHNHRYLPPADVSVNLSKLSKAQKEEISSRC